MLVHVFRWILFFPFRTTTTPEIASSCVYYHLFLSLSEIQVAWHIIIIMVVVTPSFARERKNRTKVTSSTLSSSQTHFVSPFFNLHKKSLSEHWNSIRIKMNASRVILARRPKIAMHIQLSDVLFLLTFFYLSECKFELLASLKTSQNQKLGLNGWFKRNQQNVCHLIFG